MRNTNPSMTFCWDRDPYQSLFGIPRGPYCSLFWNPLELFSGPKKGMIGTLGIPTGRDSKKGDDRDPRDP